MKTLAVPCSESTRREASRAPVHAAFIDAGSGCRRGRPPPPTPIPSSSARRASARPTHVSARASSRRRTSSAVAGIDLAGRPRPADARPRAAHSRAAVPRPDAAAGHVAGVGRGVGPAHQVEHAGQGPGGVEVVVHLLAGTGPRRRRPARRPCAGVDHRTVGQGVGRARSAGPSRPAGPARPRRRPWSPGSPRWATGSGTGARAGGRPRASLRSSRSDREVKLPSDLDIFSPSMVTQPLCTQWRANSRPTATAWARSFSWWGKIRSMAPPWRSNPSPSRSRDITTHSVCHPGRPGPQGDAQVGSPGLAFFHSTKSRGERFSSSASTRAPDRSESRDWWASSP